MKIKPQGKADEGENKPRQVDIGSFRFTDTGNPLSKRGKIIGGIILLVVALAVLLGVLLFSEGSPMRIGTQSTEVQTENGGYLKASMPPTPGYNLVNGDSAGEIGVNGDIGIVSEEGDVWLYASVQDEGYFEKFADSLSADSTSDKGIDVQKQDENTIVYEEAGKHRVLLHASGIPGTLLVTTGKCPISEAEGWVNKICFEYTQLNPDGEE